jgi:cyanate permease
VSLVALVSAISSFAVGWIPARWPSRFILSVCAALMCFGILVMLALSSTAEAFIGGAAFGLGLGGIFTLLPVVWADYFGRASYGAIRGAALSMQVLAQACGPIAAGMLRDSYGDYTRSLMLFAILSGAAAVVALVAKRPSGRPSDIKVRQPARPGVGR